MRLAFAGAVDVGVIEATQAALDAALEKAQQRLWLRQFGVLHQAHHAQQEGLFE